MQEKGSIQSEKKKTILRPILRKKDSHLKKKVPKKV